MNQRSAAIGVLLLLLIPFALAHGEQTFLERYSVYVFVGIVVLFLFLLFKFVKKLIVIGIIVAAVAVLAGLFLTDKTSELGIVGEIHYHIDFKVYLNSVPYNFSQDKYMSIDNKSLSNFVHLHDMDGKVIHKHAEGMTLGFFFETLEMKLNHTCLVLDDESFYCNEGDKVLKMYVNGKHNDEYDKYDIQDGDKILLSYGDETEEEIQQQIASVSDEACIYSLKCPEKGSPPEEATCIGETCTVEG